MGLLDDFFQGILNMIEDPDGSKAEEARRDAERRRILEEKNMRREQYSRNTWTCPKCGNTNYGGQRCRECRNGNPNIPSNLW